MPDTPSTSNQPPREFVERRKGKDVVSRVISIIAVVGWAIAIGTILLLDRARPESATYFDRLFGNVVRSSWNAGLLRFALIALIAALCICIIGFVLNMTRHKRKTDKYNKSIIVVGCFSAVALVWFLFSFYSYL